MTEENIKNKKSREQLKPSHFSFKRVFLITRRVLRQISRDRRTFGMIIIMPIIVMLIFGFALGGDIKNIPILVDDEDIGYTGMIAPGVNETFYFGENITSALRKDDRVHYNAGNFLNNKKNVDDGQYYAAIFIPSNFSESIYNKTQGDQINVTIFLYIDATKPSIKATILVALQDAMQSALGSKGIIIDEKFAFGGVEFTGLDTSIPSVIAFVISFLILLISLLTIKRESLGGTEERLYATPLRSSERLVGYTFALTILALIMVTAILIISIVLFGVIIQGDIILLVIMLSLFSLLHVLLAVFLSNFAKNELQAIQIAPLIALPSMALSGLLVPVNSFPFFVQVIAKFIPLYYGNRIFEGIMLKGWNIIQLWPDILIITIMALIFLVLAIFTVKDKIKA
ncbi:MAG: ABC transporter permease [Promethearchaeota archaeon]